jgi:hypothetical protein
MDTMVRKPFKLTISRAQRCRFQHIRFVAITVLTLQITRKSQQRNEALCSLDIRWPDEMFLLSFGVSFKQNVYWRRYYVFFSELFHMNFH